jgi:hypothetical protein
MRQLGMFANCYGGVNPNCDVEVTLQTNGFEFFSAPCPQGKKTS